MFGQALADDGVFTPPQITRKIPGYAFLLSLILPGLGQLYCGKKVRGAVCMVSFGVSAYLLFANWPSIARGRSYIWLGALNVAMLTYAFGFLDAYFTAREVDAGIDLQVDVQNPRIALLLNFFTNGFGYFYLGERTKGLLVFLVLSFANRALIAGAGPIYGLVLPAFTAYHAYIIARTHLRDALGQEAWITARQVMRGSSKLPAWVPMSFAGIVVAGFVGFVVLTHMAAKFNPSDHSAAIFNEQVNPKDFEDPKHQVRMLFPEGWQFDRSKEKELVFAKAHNGSCVVELSASGHVPLRTLSSEANLIGEILVRNDTKYNLVASSQSELAGYPAQELEFVVTSHYRTVRQREIITQRKLASYRLILTKASDSDQQCEAEMNWIRRNIQIGQ